MAQLKKKASRQNSAKRDLQVKHAKQRAAAAAAAAPKR